MKLAKLKKISNLREIWKNEASDFTNWLAQDENLNILGDAIGCDLELLKTEADVGDFNLDILAKDSSSDKNVIIENQLENTNHDHLGKIITYAAGLDASLAVWIVKKARDEHIKAIEWLNNITDDKIGFFLLEIEVLQINDSAPAVRFNIVAKPNEWSKAVKADITSNQLTDTKLNQLNFWTEFRSYAEKKKIPFGIPAAKGQHWFNLYIGSGEAHIDLIVNSRDNCIRCGLYISNNKELFNLLKTNKENIEKEIGKADWVEASKATRIIIKKEVKSLLPTDEKERAEQFDWFINTATILKKTLLPLIKKFKA